MTYGFSRDDVGTFLPTYLKQGLLEKDPFETIDEEGVGALIKMSAEMGKKNALHCIAKAGICGEHGGDPTSIRFFIRSGLDYISCSPARLPVARLAAAQCAVEDERKKRQIAEEEAQTLARKFSKGSQWREGQGL
jgi:pyruvate,orthophosphate dikinase